MMKHSFEWISFVYFCFLLFAPHNKRPNKEEQVSTESQSKANFSTKTRINVKMRSFSIPLTFIALTFAAPIASTTSKKLYSNGILTILYLNQRKCNKIFDIHFASFKIYLRIKLRINMTLQIIH